MKKRAILSRMTLLLLAVTLVCLCLPLTACERDAGPLRILLDGPIEETGETLKAALVAAGLPEDIELEYVPTDDQEERNGALTRLRTEIMAGGGPDVFIETALAVDSLFLMPEKSMELGLFLPLDKYLDDAKYMDLSNMNPTVLAAGKNDKGQMLLPILYRTPLSIFLSSEEAQHTPDPALCWEDMLGEDAGILKASTAFLGVTNATPEFYGKSPLAASLGKLADYREKQLTFTEEELKERLYQILRQEKLHQDGVFREELPAYFNTDGLGPMFPQANDAYHVDSIAKFLLGDANNGKLSKQNLTLAPVYSETGGVTAQIQAFAAVNANTRQPEEAFLVLDVLLGPEYLGSSILATGTSDNLVYDNSYTEDFPIVSQMSKEKVTLGENLFNNYVNLKAAITSVQFADSLTRALDDLSLQAARVYLEKGSDGEAEIDRLVEDAYRTMRQSLSE